MVASPHPGKLGHGHVARDTLAALTSGQMVTVGRDILDTFFMAGQAGRVGIVFLAVPAARSVAVEAA